MGDNETANCAYVRAYVRPCERECVDAREHETVPACEYTWLRSRMRVCVRASERA